MLSVGGRPGMRDGNGVQDCCDRLNWGALDHTSSASQLSVLQVSHDIGI